MVPGPSGGACWTHGSESSCPPALCGFAQVPSTAFEHFLGLPRGLYNHSAESPGPGDLVCVMQGPGASRALSACVLAYKMGGQTGARGPLGPAFSVSGKLGVVVSDRDMPRPANAVVLQPERARPLPPSRAALLSSGTLRARLLVHGHGAERGQRPFFGRTALRSVTTHAPERDARAVLVVSRPQPRRTGRAGGVCRVTRPPLLHWVLFLVRCSGY